MLDRMYISAMVSMLLLLGALASPPPSPPPHRVESTLRGMMSHYWRNHTEEVGRGWWFSCGQTGGLAGPSSPAQQPDLSRWYECRCEEDATRRCLNCFRWWDGHMLETLANVGLQGGSAAAGLLDVPASFLKFSPYNATFPSNQSMYVDDFLWYTLAYIRVFEWSQNTSYLSAAEALYEYVWRRGAAVEGSCGGVVWNTDYTGGTAKVSITLLQMLQASARLALLPAVSAARRPTYRARAWSLWQWLASIPGAGDGTNPPPYLDTLGLVPGGVVSRTGAASSGGCCNGTHAATDRSGAKMGRCVGDGSYGYTYNQGMFIGTMGFLHVLFSSGGGRGMLGHGAGANRTSTFIDMATRVIDAVMTHLTDPSGILIEGNISAPFLYSGQTCAYTYDPAGSDVYSYKGVFFMHLDYFLASTASDPALPAAQRARYEAWIKTNSAAVWSISTRVPTSVDVADVCQLPLSRNHTGNASHNVGPKFRYVWSSASSSATTAAEPSRTSPAPVCGGRSDGISACCLDPRTQQSALNLFVAHVNVVHREQRRQLATGRHSWGRRGGHDVIRDSV